jgi:hypothetical protein
VPLLRRSCPEGAGGYGGSYQVNLDDEEAVGLGGVELIRALTALQYVDDDVDLPLPRPGFAERIEEITTEI